MRHLDVPKIIVPKVAATVTLVEAYSPLTSSAIYLQRHLSPSELVRNGAEKDLIPTAWSEHKRHVSLRVCLKRNSVYIREARSITPIRKARSEDKENTGDDIKRGEDVNSVVLPRHKCQREEEKERHCCN